MYKKKDKHEQVNITLHIIFNIINFIKFNLKYLLI